MDNQAGNAVLATSASGGLINWLTQADLIISVLVGVLSAVGIIYSIIWHRVRINKARTKSNESSN